MIDASAVARVVGIETKFQDLRAGGVLFLPQRIAVIAQGATTKSYETTKFQGTGAGMVGARLGYGSPSHLIARKLFPTDGDGVGTIPVTFYPLEDADGAVAASGSIVPSGTQTKAGAYRVSIANVVSDPFVIPASASVTKLCELIGEAIAAKLEMPMDRAYTYGTVTQTPSGGNTGNGTLTALSVTDEPIPGDYVLTCTAAAAHGGTFKLVDPRGTTEAGLAMTGGTGAATVLEAMGVEFTLTDGTTDFAVGDSFTITVPATTVELETKWAGESGNDIRVEVIGEDLGVTFAITQPTGGLVNPSVEPALAAFGNVWESLVLNAMNIADTTALDALQTAGEGRWGELVRKPFVAFTGNTETTVEEATAVSSTRRDDRINAQLVAPGSDELPFVVAARQLAKIARVANNNPPTDYGSQRATGLVPGDEGDQWNYVQRDQAVKAGSSTCEVKSDVVCLADVVTFYRPEGEEVPAYRYVVDIVKLQNILFNLDLVFAKPEWDGAPLIPDNQPTVNPNARQPKSAVAAACTMIDSLGLNAIISDPKTAKRNTFASIDAQNPKRLNVETTVQLSGNTNIIPVTLNFGFFFGSAGSAG